MATTAWLDQLEARSRERPDRVLRLRGRVIGPAGAPEPFELLLYRGFASSTTHPTAWDPDQPVCPADLELERVELLAGPLNPQAEQLLAASGAAADFLGPEAWR